MEMKRKTALLGRLMAVEDRIVAAGARAGRSRGEVTLVAVTKTVSVEAARAISDWGVDQLGESRPQELWRKAATVDRLVWWHLIGHLQRNKVEQTLPLVHLIHSVDSLRLLDAIEKEAARQVRVVDVLLQVNASREANKHGFAPEDVPAFAAEINRLHN